MYFYIVAHMNLLAAHMCDSVMVDAIQIMVQSWLTPIQMSTTVMSSSRLPEPTFNYV